MSELKKHPVEPMPGHEERRVWELSLRRNRVSDALTALLDLLAIYPEEAKRLEAARNAAGSVRGSPAAGATDGPKGSLRQELEAQFRAGGARI